MELTHSVRPAIDNGVGLLAGPLKDFINIEAVKLRDILNLNHFLNHDPTFWMVCADREFSVVVECSQAQESVVVLNLGRGKVI